MANNPFDREIFNVRERPLSSDWNRAQSQLDRTRRGLQYFSTLRRTSSAGDAPIGVPNEGFYGDGFKVYAFGGMTVAVQVGMGFAFNITDIPAAIGGIVGLDDLSPYKPLHLQLPAFFTVPAAPGAGLSRFDIIEAKPYRRAENALSRDVLDPATGAFTPQLVNKTLAWTHDGQTGYAVSPAVSTVALSYKQGVAGAPGAVPATTAGYTRLAIIYVNTGTAAITEGMIRDTRKMLSPGGVMSIGARWDFKTGALPPANVTFCAPPGVRCAVVHNHTIGNIFVLWYVFLENVRAAAAVVSTRFIAANAPTAALSSTAIAHVFTPADLTRLADATQSAPVLTAFADTRTAPQTAILCSMSLQEWDVGSNLWIDIAHDALQMEAVMTVML